MLAGYLERPCCSHFGMALIFKDSTCAICGELLDRPFTATSGCAFPEGHPLWPYCDAPFAPRLFGELAPPRAVLAPEFFDLAVEAHGTGYGHILVEG